MEGMVTNLTLAKENQNHFHEYLSNNQAASPGLELIVTVFTTGFWPSYESSDLSLPTEMVKCVEVFKEFYQTKTKHRKLTWIYSLGICNINRKFEQKTIELIVGTYQVAVLLLFNASDKLSYLDIKTQLNGARFNIIKRSTAVYLESRANQGASCFRKTASEFACAVELDPLSDCLLSPVPIRGASTSTKDRIGSGFGFSNGTLFPEVINSCMANTCCKSLFSDSP
ncbi:unnamed protein product [Fraxinus pennsylvanica]|uniref:Cullin family profile domain-containing protein n=1 Tax=Fraxinus pennsylvanica TaxID=56036 RepID=A0AAD1ZZE4_9LAMI|nr:unnamed protein product [Fraxinus pennsylvanica]